MRHKLICYVRQHIVFMNFVQSNFFKSAFCLCGREYNLFLALNTLFKAYSNNLNGLAAIKGFFCWCRNKINLVIQSLL